MKLIIALCLFVTAVTSTPVKTENLNREVPPKYYAKEIINVVFQKYKYSENDVKIYFRSQADPKSLIPVDIMNSTQVVDLGFTPTKDTVCLVHGWQNKYNSPFCDIVSKAFLDVQDINVFVIDWSYMADGTYEHAFFNVPVVGKKVGTLIKHLVANNNLNLNKTSIVGHSLGAHVAGLAGFALDGQINHIVGLDPALPLFSFNNTDDRLDTTDAKFVQIIHTNGGKLGFDVDIGHADYYPNGGRDQPGCILDVTGSCAHSRSYQYYAESLISGGFSAQKCQNYEEFKNNECSGQTSYMGEYHIDQEATGAYYLDTNDQSPYAKN